VGGNKRGKKQRVQNILYELIIIIIPEKIKKSIGNIEGNIEEK
jgi:hypothetical protein